MYCFSRNKPPSESLTPKKTFNPKKFNILMEQNQNSYLPSNSKYFISKPCEGSRTTSISHNVPTTSESNCCNTIMSQEYASAEAMIQLHNSYQSSPQKLFNNNPNNSSMKEKENNEIPKKRWLREAVLDQQKWDNQDLAQPLNWNDDARLIECENQKRPSVLVRVEKSEKKEISKTDLQLAMALVELRHSTKFCKY